MHLGRSGGLSSHEIVSSVQDEAGYIWIGTNNGLQRYDGTRYITFRYHKNNPRSIPHNSILNIYIDKKKNLWVITHDGKLGIFDKATFAYRPVRIDLDNEHWLMAERSLVEDLEGNLFLSYAGFALLTWNEAKMEFSAKYNPIPLKPDWRPLDIAQQPGTRKYWVGLQDGLAIYNADTKQWSYNNHNTEKEPVIESLGAIPVPTNFLFDKNNRFWFTTWIGAPVMFSYDYAKNQRVLDHYRVNFMNNEYHEVRGFVQQRDGTIWIYGLGIFAKYLEKERTFQPVDNSYRNEQSIEFERINDLMEDREDNIWVSTNNNGLYWFNPGAQFFTNVRHVNRINKLPGKGDLMSFLRTPDGGLFAGAWGDGLYRYDKDFNPIPVSIKGFPEEQPPWIWSMCYSRDSSIIWMASQPGIYRVDTRTWKYEYFSPQLLGHRTVRQVLTDRHDNLWIGSQSLGLFKWNRSKAKKKFEDGLTQFKGVPNNSQVACIYNDWQGNVWVGTTGHGVFVIDPVTDKVLLQLNNKEDEGRRIGWGGSGAILQYDDSTVMVAANDIFLFNLKQQRITRTIRMPESIPSLISAMEKDREGYLWISTTTGLFRVNPRNDIFIHFDRVDGIDNDRFILAASYQLPDGKLVFGSSNQFIYFDPAEVRINNPSPDITITGFKMMNRPLLVDSLLRKGSVRIAPDENTIAIEFSGLRYNGTYLIKYKLEGIDRNWKAADQNYHAIYTYLPPGRYTFLARSEDAEGNTGKHVTRLEITVHPHFWKTWWFYSLVAVLAIVVLYGIDRERTKRQQDLQRMRTEIAENLYKDVSTTLNNINLLSEMAKIKADKDINRSKEYIDQISTKSHNMIIAMDDILWSIDPENDSMEKTLLRMMEFTDALRNRYSTPIELVVDRKVGTLKLDMKTRNEFFLLFKTGLRMIVQYAGGKDTLINIDLFRGKLSLKLQDATARLDHNVEEIERSIREINGRSTYIKAEADIQYDRNGIAIILLIPTK